MKQYKDMTKTELIAVIADKDEEVINLAETLDEQRFRIDDLVKTIKDLKSGPMNAVAISVEDMPRKLLSMIRPYQPEQQNMIIGKVIMELSVEKSQIVKEAKQHLTRSEESLSQFLLVVNGSKYAEVKA